MIPKQLKIVQEAVSKLIVTVSVEFEEDVSQDVTQMFDNIPVGDTKNDVGLDDFKYPIKSKDDFLIKLLEMNR